MLAKAASACFGLGVCLGATCAKRRLSPQNKSIHYKTDPLMYRVSICTSTTVTIITNKHNSAKAMLVAFCSPTWSQVLLRSESATLRSVRPSGDARHEGIGRSSLRVVPKLSPTTGNGKPHIRTTHGQNSLHWSLLACD